MNYLRHLGYQSSIYAKNIRKQEKAYNEHKGQIPALLC